MTILFRRTLSLTLCALAIAYAGLVVPPRSGAPDAAKTPLAVTRLYRMNDAGTALLPMNARTLADLTSVPAIGLPRSATLPPPLLVSRPAGTALAALFYSGDGSPAQNLLIRVIDVRTGRARGPMFHPAVPVWIDSISPDGTKLYAFQREQGPPTQALQRTTYYVLSASTGDVLHASPVRHFCCGSDVDDFLHQRLYTLITARASDPRSASQIPQLRAEDLRTGKELGHVSLPHLHAGSWTTERQVDGMPLIRAWTPGIALSPEGTHVAIVDPSSDQLTVIDAMTMRAVRTLSLHHPSGMLEKLGSLLGLSPGTAYAKGAEGVDLTARYSPDGRLLYITGTRGSVTKAGKLTWTQLGVRVVDVSTGTIVAERFQGTPLVWTTAAPDGAVYVVTAGKTGEGAFGCPCTVQRLNPHTLATEARRSGMGGYNTFPNLYFLKGNQSTGAGTSPRAGSHAGSGPFRVQVQLDPYFKQHPLPTGCGTTQIVRIVAGFVRAFNQDDTSGIARYLDLKNLSAYAVGGNLKNGNYVPEISSSNAARILAYIATRHQHHERLQLLDLKVVPYPRPGYSGPAGYVVVGPALRRTADDLVVAKNIVGVKALINCKVQRIDSWIQSGKYIKPPASAGWGAQ